MKKLIVLTLLAAFSFFTYAQDIDQKNVPAVLLNSFQLKFANASDVDWELQKGLYHVDFEINDKNNEVWMDDKGNILKHTQELWGSEIPASVITTIRSKCKFFDLDDADRTEEEGKVIYYINFEMDHKDHDLEIDGKGNLLKYRQELKDSEIPVTVLNSVTTSYAGYEIRDADLIEEGGKTFYDLELRKSKEKLHVKFNPEGKVVEIL